MRFGSARHDEDGKYRGGKKGDQTGHEVEMQNFYMHSKGWVILRAVDDDIAAKLSDLMKAACENDNIGYDKDTREQIYDCGTKTKTKCNCDCSSLVRQIVKEAGIKVGDFYTGDEAETLLGTGKFKKFGCSSEADAKNGDILVTKTKGHTGICIGDKKTDRPTIKRGYKDSEKGGTWCRELQESLNSIGITDFSGSKLKIDGSCGEKTEEAIESFQKQAMLLCIYPGRVDGSFGPLSWAALDEILSWNPVRVRVTTALNVRYGPSTENPVKKIVKEGSEFMSDQVADNGWRHIYDGTFEGWASGKYLKILD